MCQPAIQTQNISEHCPSQQSGLWRRPLLQPASASVVFAAKQRQNFALQSVGKSTSINMYACLVTMLREIVTVLCSCCCLVAGVLGGGGCGLGYWMVTQCRWLMVSTSRLPAVAAASFISILSLWPGIIILALSYGDCGGVTADTEDHNSRAAPQHRYTGREMLSPIQDIEDKIVFLRPPAAFLVWPIDVCWSFLAGDSQAVNNWSVEWIREVLPMKGHNCTTLPAFPIIIQMSNCKNVKCQICRYQMD